MSYLGIGNLFTQFLTRRPNPTLIQQPPISTIPKRWNSVSTDQDWLRDRAFGTSRFNKIAIGTDMQLSKGVSSTRAFVDWSYTVGSAGYEIRSMETNTRKVDYSEQPGVFDEIETRSGRAYMNGKEVRFEAVKVIHQFPRQDGFSRHTKAVYFQVFEGEASHPSLRYDAPVGETNNPLVYRLDFGMSSLFIGSQQLFSEAMSTKTGVKLMAAPAHEQVSLEHQFAVGLYNQLQIQSGKILSQRADNPNTSFTQRVVVGTEEYEITLREAVPALLPEPGLSPMMARCSENSSYALFVSIVTSGGKLVVASLQSADVTNEYQVVLPGGRGGGEKVFYIRPSLG